MPNPSHHAIGYIELGVNDLVEARSFYTSAFGWEFNDYGPAYSGIKSTDGVGEVGGLNPNSVSSADGPLVLIFSEDLKASVNAVREAGGKIAVEPYEYPGGSRFEFFDPSGNRLGVFASA